MGKKNTSGDVFGIRLFKKQAFLPPSRSCHRNAWIKEHLWIDRCTLLSGAIRGLFDITQYLFYPIRQLTTGYAE